MDDRFKLLAKQLIRGVKVVEGSKVSIFMTDFSAMEAVEAFVSECYQVGAIPQVLATDEKFDRLAVAYASDEVLTQAPPLEINAMQWADVHVSFRAMVPPDPDFLDERRIAIQKKGKGEVSTSRWKETRWCLVRLPSQEWADLIGVSYDGLLGEFFAGCIADWESIEMQQLQLCSVLDGAKKIRIVSKDTDLVLGVGGRKWMSFAGEANLPDGEVATAPIDDDVNGHITFPGRFWFSGVPVTDLRLDFKNGRVVSHTASQGQEFVTNILATDAGSTALGELGIGTNGKVQTFTGDLLIDEKILGTVHVALGRAYPECLGVNESAVHWDIVKDLREPGGYLYVDDWALISDGQLSEMLSIFSQ
jgi:aminopeptidase